MFKLSSLQIPDDIESWEGDSLYNKPGTQWSVEGEFETVQDLIKFPKKHDHIYMVTISGVLVTKEEVETIDNYFKQGVPVQGEVHDS